MRKYKVTVITGVEKYETRTYETHIASKYEFEKAVEDVARTNPKQAVMFGDSLAFVAGDFVSAQLGEIVEVEA